MNVLITYVLGFIITLWLLHKTEGLGIYNDFDGEKDYVNMDDYDSNAQAYMVFSLFWFLTVPLLAIIWTIQFLEMFSEWIDEINKLKK